MNNTFDFSRFGKLLSRDGKIYFRNFGITLAIFCSIPFMLWLLTLAFGFTMPSMMRWFGIFIGIFIVSLLVPAKAFGYMNLPREGIRYAMLPVSNLEKYLSYVLFCLLTPLAVFLVSYGIDSLLTLLPWGGFHHYIRSFNPIDITVDFFNEISENGGVVANVDTNGDLQTVVDMMRRMGKGMTFNLIVSCIFTAGFIMLGNLLFKTHKTGKSFGILMGVSYVTSMISRTASFFYTNRLQEMVFQGEETLALAAAGDMVGTLTLVSVIFTSLLAIGVFIGIYFKLKTQKY